MLIEKIPQLSCALRRCAMIKNQKLLPPDALCGEKHKLNHYSLLLRWLVAYRIRCPDFENRLPRRAQATVVPFSIDDLVIKAKACTHAGVISREKSNRLHVFTSFGRIGSSSRSRKFAGFRVEGHPLKSTSTEDFDRSSRAWGGTLNLILSLSTGNHPVASQVIAGIRHLFPDLY